MNDLAYASLFLLIFALSLMLYGLLLARTGDQNLMPYRTAHSIRNEDDVRRVGRIVVIVGLVLGTAMILTFALTR